jgi:hypothetical protein
LDATHGKKLPIRSGSGTIVNGNEFGFCRPRQERDHDESDHHFDCRDCALGDCRSGSERAAQHGHDNNDTDDDPDRDDDDDDADKIYHPQDRPSPRNSQACAAQESRSPSRPQDERQSDRQNLDNEELSPSRS